MMELRYGFLGMGLARRAARGATRRGTRKPAGGRFGGGGALSRSFAIVVRRPITRSSTWSTETRDVVVGGDMPGNTSGLPGSAPSAAAIVRHACTPAAFFSMVASAA